MVPRAVQVKQRPQYVHNECDEIELEIRREKRAVNIYKGSNSIPSDLAGTTPGDERDCSAFSRSG